MKILELTYSRGETRQIFAQFQPTNLHFSIKAEIEEGEDLHEAYGKLEKIVDDEIALQLTILDEKMSGKIVRQAAKIVADKNIPSPF